MPALLFQLFRRQTKGDQKNGIYYVAFPSMGYHNYSPEYFGPVKFLGPDDRMENGDFEEVGSDGRLVAWHGAQSLCQEDADRGQQCVRLAGVKGGKDQMLISRRYAVEPDCDYSVTLRHTGDSMFIYALFYDKNGERVADPARRFFWTPAIDRWTTVVCQGRVPADAASCAIALRNFDSHGYGGAKADAVEFHGGEQYSPTK